MGGKQLKSYKEKYRKAADLKQKKKKFLASCYFRRIKETLATL